VSRKSVRAAVLLWNVFGARDLGQKALWLGALCRIMEISRSFNSSLSLPPTLDLVAAGRCKS
jgi:hypothetical protein